MTRYAGGFRNAFDCFGSYAWFNFIGGTYFINTAWCGTISAFFFLNKTNFQTRNWRFWRFFFIFFRVRENWNMEEERPGIRYLLLPNPRALPSTQWPSPITVTHFLNFPRDYFLGFLGVHYTYLHMYGGGGIALKLGCRKIKTKKKKFSLGKIWLLRKWLLRKPHLPPERCVIDRTFFFLFPMPLSHGSWFMEGVDLNI